MQVPSVLQTDKKKKEKKEKDQIVVPIEELSPIAQPLAQKKLLKKLHKTVKKGNAFTRTSIAGVIQDLQYAWLASKQRQLKRGVKEVVKGIRKGERG
jgi:H/ACA ribonucleoprotein complex subunit 2